MTQEMQKQAVGSLAAALSKTMRATRPAMAQVGNFSNAATAAALARARQAAQLARQSGTVAKQVGSDIALGSKVLGQQAAAAARPAVNYTRTAVPDTLKFMAGKAPDEKLFQGVRGTAKDLYNISTLKQIPGLDRPVTAGVLPRTRLSDPRTYGNFVTSARPAVSRPLDKTRQGIAHAWRTAGKGSLATTGAAVGGTLLDPYGTAARAANLLYQEINPNLRTPNFRDREYGKQVLNATAKYLPQAVARAVQKRFSPDKFKATPLENFTNDVFANSALDVYRDNLNSGLKYNPLMRLGHRLRGLTPLGMLTNSAISSVAKPLNEEQFKSNMLQAALKQNWAEQPVNDPMLQYLIQTLPPDTPEFNPITHVDTIPDRAAYHGQKYYRQTPENKDWLNKFYRPPLSPAGQLPFTQRMPINVGNFLRANVARPGYQNALNTLQQSPLFNDYNAPPVSAAEILRRFAR